MLRRTVAYFRSLPSVFIDGAIYVMLAIMTANAVMLASDNAFKYISGEMLFYITWSNAVINSGLLAAKMFRSTAFADHKQKEKDETAMIARSFQGPKP